VSSSTQSVIDSRIRSHYRWSYRTFTDMWHRLLSATGRLSPLVRAGIIAGVVLAAVLYPITAIGGLSIQAGTRMLGELPSELTMRPPAQTTYVYARDGKTLLTTFYEEHRRYTPINEVSPYMLQAIVASEDARFFDHNGVDTKGIARAFVANIESDQVEQGASTIAMQYVRMALRDGAETAEQVRAATEQTAARKLREVRLAMEIEKQLSTTEILERYRDPAYFGHRAYGISAAAQICFSKRPAATQRRNWVIDRMAQLGYVGAEVAREEKEKPIELDLTDPPNDCVSVPEKNNHRGFFCDFFRTWWTSQPAFGDNPLQREDALRRGGYRVITSLDPEIQEIAQGHVVDKERIGSPYAHGLVAIEPGTGRVKSMAVNRRFSL